MHILRINSVMTPFPYSVEDRAFISEAVRLMARYDIRHLPVIRDGELGGVLSQRMIDQWLATGGTTSGRVHEIRLEEPYIVEIGAPLETVLVHLAERHLECALVVKDGRLAGIFTMIDAYRRYAQELHRQRTGDSGDDAA